MTKVLIEDSTLTNIANAIRNKNNSDTTYKPNQMPSAIEDISSGGEEEYFNLNMQSGSNVLKTIKKLPQYIFNGTDCSSMFSNVLVETIDFSNFDTSNVTTMRSMFSGSSIKNLNLNALDTQNVRDMSYMFSQCRSLTELEIDSINTAKVENMSYMFQQNISLTNLDLRKFDTSNVTNMQTMFISCSNLIELNISEFDMSKVNNVNNMLANNSKLTNLNFGYNLGKGFTQNQSNYGNYTLYFLALTSLTHESLMSIINNLYDLNLAYDVENEGTLYSQKLVLGSTNLAKLTAEEISLATAKGWSVS